MKRELLGDHQQRRNPLEGLQQALGHGLAVAARIGWKVFQSAVLKALFIIDEEHLETAIEQDVDLLPLFLIYAPQWVKYSRQIAGRMYGGRGIYEHKITLENSLKWLKEQCERRKRGYYDVIVNLPEPAGSETSEIEESDAEDVFPPPGADMKRVMWFWNNVQRLTRFVFTGEVPKSSKKWGIAHLKWLAEQKKQGKKISELFEEVTGKERKTK